MATRARKSREINFNFNGNFVSGQEWKEGEPTRHVLFLHGWQDNSNSFVKLVDLLPRDWWMVAIDFPGHGHSSQRAEGAAYYITDWICDVHHVVRNLGWTKFTIIGHSMGAGVALSYAALFPDSVEAVVSLDVVKQLSDIPGTTVKVLRNAVIALTDFDDEDKRPKEIYDSKEDAVNCWYEKHKINMTKEAADIILQRGLETLPNGKLQIRRDLRLTLPPLFRIPLDQHRQLMKELKCDLVITKCRDSPDWESAEINQEFMDIYEKNCPKFKRIEVSGLHHVHVDTPERVAPEILSFFQEK